MLSAICTDEDHARAIDRLLTLFRNDPDDDPSNAVAIQQLADLIYAYERAA